MYIDKTGFLRSGHMYIAIRRCTKSMKHNPSIANRHNFLICLTPPEIRKLCIQLALYDRSNFMLYIKICKRA